MSTTFSRKLSAQFCHVLHLLQRLTVHSLAALGLRAGTRNQLHDGRFLPAQRILRFWEHDGAPDECRYVLGAAVSSRTLRLTQARRSDKIAKSSASGQAGPIRSLGVKVSGATTSRCWPSILGAIVLQDDQEAGTAPYQP